MIAQGSPAMSPRTGGHKGLSRRKYVMLRLISLDAFYDRTQVLHDIDLRVEEGEIVGLVGQTPPARAAPC